MNTFHDYCKSQIKRFAGRMGWVDPKENSAPARDLVEALERGARGNSETAKRIVDTLIESTPGPDGRVYCATVPDILRAAAAINEQTSTGPRFGFAGCEKCNHSGWIAMEKNGYDYSAACACRK